MSGESGEREIPVGSGSVYTIGATVTQERVADLLCGALEGGSTYWCEKIRMKDNDYGHWTYAHEAIAAGLPFTLWHHGENEPDEIENSRERIEKALSEMPSAHTADFLNENDDADTSDTFLQYLCFGEMIYG